MKEITALLITTFLLGKVYTQRVYTIANGYWSNPAVWNTGTIPALDDSVIIDDYILLDTNITIGNGLLFIDGCGVLCGDYDVSGSFTNYGEIRIRNGNITDSSYNYNFYSCSGYNIIYSNQGGFLDNCCGGSVYTSYPVNCDGFPRACNNVLSTKDITPSNHLIISNSSNGFEIIVSDDLLGYTLQIYSYDGRLLHTLLLQNRNMTISDIFPNGLLLFKVGNYTAKAIKF